MSTTALAADRDRRDPQTRGRWPDRGSLAAAAIGFASCAEPFEGHLAMYHDSKPRDRIEVLLQLLGSTRRATLASLEVELIK
jgi:hypothetical protein